MLHALPIVIYILCNMHLIGLGLYKNINHVIMFYIALSIMGHEHMNVQSITDSACQDHYREKKSFCY